MPAGRWSDGGCWEVCLEMEWGAWDGAMGDAGDGGLLEAEGGD